VSKFGRKDEKLFRKTKSKNWFIKFYYKFKNLKFFFLKDQFDMIIDNSRLPFEPEICNSDPALSMLLFHFHVLLENFTIDCLRPFYLLLKNTAQFSKSFLPSILHDDDFEAFAQFKKINTEPLAFYTCKNGHVYSIADCTKPATVGVCPTCKEPIGGLSYKLADGNQKLDDLIEKTQYGYFLSDIIERTTPQSIRNMGLLNTSMLRLILNCTMYLSSIKSREETFNVINKSLNLNKDELGDFLLKQIKIEINTLSKSLQHSPDETVLFVHFILNQFKVLKTKVSNFDGYLKTKEDRVKYEDIFCNVVLKEIIGNDSTDKLIQQCTNVLTNDSQNADSDQLFRIAYDLLEPSSEKNASFIMEKKCWAFRRQITVQSMINAFKSSNYSKKRALNLKLLEEFILKINELQALKYLPPICKMVNLLFIMFNRQMDKSNANNNKISDLISSQNDNSFKEIIRAGMLAFLDAWKIISPTFIQKANLTNKFRVKDLEEFESLPISYLLSNSSSNGVYIHSLISYLIRLHNEFIEFYLNFKKSNSKEKINIDYANKIELENLSMNDCINFSVDKEILQIVYMHSNYSLENVQETNLEFNFLKIQQTIQNRFLLDKPLITNKVKTLMNMESFVYKR
jgi:hypothetical protein